MANLRKNIARKRSLAKRAHNKMRTSSSEQNSAFKNYTVKAGREKGLNETINEVKALREEFFSKNPDVKPESKPSYVYHRYGKNSVRKIKVV